jgi:hypothetical protein
MYCDTWVSWLGSSVAWVLRLVDSELCHNQNQYTVKKLQRSQKFEYGLLTVGVILATLLLFLCCQFFVVCYSMPPYDMSHGHDSPIMDVTSVNQNYAHGVKEARTEILSALFCGHVDSQ